MSNGARPGLDGTHQRRVSLVADTDVESMRRLYARLIDRSATSFGGVLDVEPDDRADEVSRRLEERFRRRPAPDAVMIRVNGCDVGISTPARVREAAGVAGAGGFDFGTGDRSSLPGRSTRYRVIRFSCMRCADSVVCSFYDERAVPSCRKDPSHGPMELRR